MKQLSRFDASENELNISTRVFHSLLFSAHHNLAEVGINNGGSKSSELTDELHEHLLHEFVDHSTESWLIEVGGG